MTYPHTGQDVADIITRHRQLSEAEHIRFVGIGFVLGAALVAVLWAL